MKFGGPQKGGEGAESPALCYTYSQIWLHGYFSIGGAAVVSEANSSNRPDS